MLFAGGVAKKGHQEGANVDLKLQETTEAPGTAVEDDKVADLPPVAHLVGVARYLPGEPVFVPREDGPAVAWLACAANIPR